MDVNLRAMNKTGVYISEVMASNDSTTVYQKDGFVDWIELYNSSTETVDLSGYGLSDNVGRARKWQFPQGTFISPGEYKVILCDGPERSVHRRAAAHLLQDSSRGRRGGHALHPRRAGSWTRFRCR